MSTEQEIRDTLERAIAGLSYVELVVGHWTGGNDVVGGRAYGSLDDGCINLTHSDGSRSSFSLNIVRAARIGS